MLQYKFWGLLTKKINLASSNKSVYQVFFLIFASMSELRFDQFTLKFGNHGANLLKFMLYPVITGELWT